jgi:hypothetical protein
MQTELFDTAQGLEMDKKLPEGYNREGLNARGWLRRCGNDVNKRAIQSRWGVLNKSSSLYLVLVYEVTFFWLVLLSHKLT